MGFRFMSINKVCPHSPRLRCGRVCTDELDHKEDVDALI